VPGAEVRSFGAHLTLAVTTAGPVFSLSRIESWDERERGVQLHGYGLEVRCYVHLLAAKSRKDTRESWTGKRGRHRVERPTATRKDQPQMDTDGHGFNRSLHELRSPPGMKTTGPKSRVRRTIEHEEEHEKENDHNARKGGVRGVIASA
jgi:hypothetical protein